jgi:hypothetical protein
LELLRLPLSLFPFMMLSYLRVCAVLEIMFKTTFFSRLFYSGFGHILSFWVPLLGMSWRPVQSSGCLNLKFQKRRHYSHRTKAYDLLAVQFRAISYHVFFGLFFDSSSYICEAENALPKYYYQDQEAFQRTSSRRTFVETIRPANPFLHKYERGRVLFLRFDVD